MIDEIPEKSIKGRGASNNPASRFDNVERARVSDGWDLEEESLTYLQTELIPEFPKTIISRNKSPDVPFEYSVNPYKGCEHGCVYCFARPSHGYLGLSPGLDFETKIFYKPEAAKLLKSELSRKNYECKPIALGINTDSYQPAEKNLKITRSLLEVLYEFNHPVSIVTKSSRILRDLDILAPMADKRLVNVLVSITTLDKQLARIMEPRASSPINRLSVIKAMSENHIPCGILFSPIIPAINDSELEAIFSAASENGATMAGYVLIRLPHELTKIFSKWLEDYFPDRKRKVLSLIKQCRDGQLYRSKFGERMTGAGPYSEMLRLRFLSSRKRHNFNQRDKETSLNVDLFSAKNQQLNLSL